MIDRELVRKFDRIYSCNSSVFLLVFLDGLNDSYSIDIEPGKIDFLKLFEENKELCLMLNSPFMTLIFPIEVDEALSQFGVMRKSNGLLIIDFRVPVGLKNTTGRLLVLFEPEVKELVFVIEDQGRLIDTIEITLKGDQCIPT